MFIGSANAAVIFFQDYESGLTSQESVIGNFSINNTNANNNGTMMMGHPSSYSNYARDQYTLSLDLTGITNALLTFDFIGNTEPHFDGFVMLANGLLLSPLSGVNYDDELHSHSWIGRNTLDGAWNSLVKFDLSAYDDSTLTLAWRFGSDLSITDTGLVWDNVLVIGDRATKGAASVPEPSSLAMLCLGLAGLRLSRKAKIA